MLLGCGSSSSPMGTTGAAGASGTDGAAADGASAGGSATAPTGASGARSGGAGGVTSSGGAGGGAGAGGAAGAGGGTAGAGGTARDAAAASGDAATGTLPCAVARVLAARCQGCHTTPPKFGAPRPLLTFADTRALGSDGKTPILQLMKDKIATGAMPPTSTPTGPLSPAEKTTLTMWLDAGAPSGAACTTDAGVSPSADAAPSGPAALPCTPNHEFRASGAPGAPYAVPLVDNTYRCFHFQVPFAAGEQAMAWAPILDDTRVLHHWILYATTATSPPPAGACSDPGRTFLMGWAPGGGNYVMPPDVGLELPAPGTYLSLEVHYNNKARLTDARDRSGVAVCTTKTARPKVAGVMTFGSRRITLAPGATNVAVNGDCPGLATRVLPAELHLLSSFPHMHQLGTKFTAAIVSGNASRSLVDIPRWDFNDQRGYPHDPATTVLKPGDVMKTECTYSNPTASTVRFGGATEDEMCFNFVMAYPIPQPMLRQCVL
jgi:hypothetical protein